MIHFYSNESFFFELWQQPLNSRLHYWSEFPHWPSWNLKLGHWITSAASCKVSFKHTQSPIWMKVKYLDKTFLQEFRQPWMEVWRLGCIEFFLYLIFIRLTLFSLYFLILRTIYFLTFFDLRPPSFANFNFCLLMGIRRNFNGKIIRFWISRRNMV